jgi:glucose dehydrogenase
MWGFLSYDPDLDLIYYGTGNPGPGTRSSGPATTSGPPGIFARNPDTGEAKWFYQWSPHDLHDYDGVNENVLLDMNWEGKQRKVILHPERNGYVYVLDRATGEVLSAKPFAPSPPARASTCRPAR